MNGREFTEVVPYKRYDRDGKTYETRYNFTKVHLDEIDLDMIHDVNNVGVNWVDDGLYWRYAGKPPVIIREDGIFAPKDSNVNEAERQAYFALSILDDKGMVSGFQKA